MTRLTIDNSGRLSLPATLAKGFGGGPLALVSHSPQHLLLAPQSAGAGMLLAGRLGALAVADLLSFFSMFRKSGVLHFALHGGSKELTFQNGEVVSAVSTFPDEELGEILFALGKVDRGTLQQVRQTAAGRSALGKALVDAGQLAAKDLWQAARAQVETIVYNLFTQHEGSFTFSESPGAATAPSFSLNTQNLIMEGLRRIDERTLFMRLIPSLDAVPLAAAAPAADLTPAEERLLATIRRGRHPVRELLRQCGFEEFDGLRLLYQLAERRLISFAPVRSVEPSGVCGEILAICNGVLVQMYRQVAPANPGYSLELRRFLRDLPQPFSFAMSEEVLCADGSVDGGRILANLDGLGADDRQRLLADALSELLFMSCIAARRDLGAASSELVQRVQTIARRIKTLSGRDA
jgi:hypothetical protein